MPIRPRRRRSTSAMRDMVSETIVHHRDLIYPLFIQEGLGLRDAISSLPSQYRWSPDMILDEIGACIELGLKSFMLFPKIKEQDKDPSASLATSPSNYYLDVARSIKKEYPDIILISDVALDPYSSHGHDGLVLDGKVDNDRTLAVLDKMAILQAEAGFDILGPSDMMDGRVGSMRAALDEVGHQDTAIMSYTAKYASGLYGPFRDALGSAPVEGADIPKDKKTYQMDPSNRREALIEAQLDVSEGADFLMVKPALHYLDIISDLKQHFSLPIAAYHVSGECAMLWAAAARGWLDYHMVMPETLTAIKRAGADLIITYFAKDFCAMMSRG